jgi:hypothetical protein
MRFAENLRTGTPKKFVGFALAEGAQELANLPTLVKYNLSCYISSICFRLLEKKEKAPGQKSTVIRSTLTFTAVNINKHALALNFYSIWLMALSTMKQCHEFDPKKH